MIDLSHLNEFVLQTPFKMETVASMLLSIREGDFLASIDLKDAYFQISVHQSSRKLLRFLSWGASLSIQSSVLRAVDCPSGLHSVVCSGICVGALPQDLSSQVPGRLAGPHLFGDGGQKQRPGSAFALSLPWDSDKLEGRSRPLADCKLPRYDHMTIDTGAVRIFLSHARVEKFLSVAEMFCTMSSPLAQLLAGGLGTPGFAGEIGSSQSTSNALSAVAFEDALVSQVGSSLAPGTAVLGGERGFVLVDGERPSSQGG